MISFQSIACFCFFCFACVWLSLVTAHKTEDNEVAVCLNKANDASCNDVPQSNEQPHWSLLWKQFKDISSAVSTTTWNDWWKGFAVQLKPSSGLSTQHQHRRIAISKPCQPSSPNCMILDVSAPSLSDGRKDDEDGSSSSSSSYPTSSYELEQMATLGTRVQHVSDYAYSPVSVVAVEPESLSSQPNHRHHWWHWWYSSSPSSTSSSSTEQHDANHPYSHNNSSSSSKYTMNDSAFAGGSHGEVWRGYKKGHPDEPLVFKRLRVEHGVPILEAGLREVYFGDLLQDVSRGVFTEYVEHFFSGSSQSGGGGGGELWIVFRDAGPTLRSLLYTGMDAGGFVVYQHSWLWTLMRMSLAQEQKGKSVALLDSVKDSTDPTSLVGKQLMSDFLRQILEAAAVLHENGIVHRDIKPANVMCQTDIDLKGLESLESLPVLNCVLGDFSSANNVFTNRNMYAEGPSRFEQTDEYAPPEAIFGVTYNRSPRVEPSFDSWSIGIVALELLLGTPHVFSVDQRTRMVLSHKLERKGATEEQIERAMYLAALSQFCIYNPAHLEKPDWPMRDGDPLHQSAMTKKSCTLNDFHRALRARDPLGWGFEATDLLLHLIWQLLAWDPNERITAAKALRHPYFTKANKALTEVKPDEENALESQMLDPRMDFGLSDSISEFKCPKCGRTFADWKSCHTHANSRRHARFCTYNHTSLPTCLNAHAMLPAHPMSGYCDIQGRRRTIEDFHAIHLLPFQQFYGIFDGHLGNFASKYAASFLYGEVSTRLASVANSVLNSETKASIETSVSEAFHAVHDNFVKAIAHKPHGFMDQSGTTATILLVTDLSIVIASLGDSRAVLSSELLMEEGPHVSSIQLTKDHVAKDPEEQIQVQDRGGKILHHNNMYRVNGSLAITRSIGDASLSKYLSRKPDVISFSRKEILDMCGGSKRQVRSHPCFFILASDGLWDTVSNQEAVELVAHVVSDSASNLSHWKEAAGLQQAAEALTHEAFVRGSTDNIGVCVVAVE